MRRMRELMSLTHGEQRVVILLLSIVVAFTVWRTFHHTAGTSLPTSANEAAQPPASPSPGIGP
jgi:hypothetical protein